MVKDCMSVIEEAELYQESAEAAVARLAALPRLEYGRCRKEEAKRMDVRVTDLDSAVKEQRFNDDLIDDEEGLVLPEPEPWHEVVDGRVLLDELVAVLRRYVVLRDSYAEAKSLWVLHTHAVETAYITPRLVLLSPEKRSGKTLTLEILEKLVWRPLRTDGISGAAFSRTVDKASPTVLVDEADSFFIEGREDLRGVLNSGHRRGGHVIKCVGKDHEPRQFATFAPVAISMIGELPWSTLEDRSIIIRMHRKMKDERVERFRMDRTPDLDRLARMVARWALDNKKDLADADPFIPEELHDRAADNWRHLLAIADLAGGEWPEKARNVAVALSGDSEAEDSSEGVMLLTDLAVLYAARSTDRLASKDICTALSAMEHRPWPEYRNRRPITPTQVAKLLEPFEVRPKDIRFGREVRKGYLLNDFGEAFARYIPPDVSATGQQACGYNELDENLSATEQPHVADKKADKVNNIKGVADVADRDGGLGKELSLFEQEKAKRP